MPTVTDANVRARLHQSASIWSAARCKLNAEKARAVFADKIAEPLGMSIEQAAYGAHLIAASNMIRAIKAVSTERGRDPREFALFAFGGNGPLFACGMARCARHQPRRRAAVGRPVLVVRAALRRRRAPLFAHVPPPAAPGRSRRDRARLEQRSPAGQRRSSPPRAFTGAQRAAAPLGGAALSGPELRAHRAGARRPDRRARWWRISRRPSATSTRGPTAIAPAPTSRSSWSSIQVVGQGLRAGRRRARARAPEPAEPAPPPPRRGLFRGDGSAAGSRRRSCAAPISQPAARAR